MTTHPDDETLSAFADGEAPEWAAHVASCASCRAGVATLRSVQAAVAAPIPPPAPEARDRAIAAAVAAGPRRSDPIELRATSGRRPGRWLVPASIAAVLLLVVGAASVLVRGSEGSRTTTAAEAPASLSPAVGRAAGGSNGGAGDSAGGGLGEIPDAPTLLARAAPGSAGKATPTVTAGPATALNGSGPINPAPGVVGTRPCEEQARAGDPSLREVVSFATATHQGAPAVVLGFSTGPAPAPVTLLLLAQADCGVLLRAVGP